MSFHYDVITVKLHQEPPTKPDQVRSKPDQGKTNPDQVRSKPDQAKTKPDQVRSKPHQTETRPDQAKTKPDQVKPNPDKFVVPILNSLQLKRLKDNDTEKGFTCILDDVYEIAFKYINKIS